MHPLPNGTEYGIHLRAPSASGGKDWVGTVTGNIVTTYWGKTGTIGNHASKTGDRSALNLIIREKVIKGYVQIDEYSFISGWDSQQKIRQPGERYTANQPIKPPATVNDITKNIIVAEALDFDF